MTLSPWRADVGLGECMTCLAGPGHTHMNCAVVAIINIVFFIILIVLVFASLLGHCLSISWGQHVLASSWFLTGQGSWLNDESTPPTPTPGTVLSTVGCGAALRARPQAAGRGVSDGIPALSPRGPDDCTALHFCEVWADVVWQTQVLLLKSWSHPIQPPGRGHTRRCT